MRATAEQRLLDLWERGDGRSGIEKALLCLSVDGARPDVDLADLPLGERNRRLLEVCQRFLGSKIAGYLECPSCGCGIEFELEPASFLERAVGASGESHGVLHVDDYVVEFRSPTSADLARVSSSASVDDARERLIETCLMRCERTGVEVAARALPVHVIERVTDALHELDPMCQIVCRFV